MVRAGAIIAGALLSVAVLAHAPDPAPAARNAVPARLLEGMGGYRFDIAASDPLAQRYFDQGIVLAWGFNFAEAERSFIEAARLEPDCAICWWGAAYARGPSINHDMDPAALAAARAHIRRATQLLPRASARQRALIEALGKRYAAGAKRPGAPDDSAYVRAMRAVYQRHPDDTDVLTLLADALMVPHGRDFWTRSGAPRPWTHEILGLLERALALAPDHPGANHYYVHVLEDSPYPERARESAQRLQTIAPGVAHLVHMPAHVLLRLGDYAGAAQANRNAIAADRAYLATTDADPAYVAGYVEHNYHFLWYASLMAGDSHSAMAAAQELARYAGSDAAAGIARGTRQHFLALPLYTMVRFGQWQAILDAPRPAPASAYADGVWRYARGMALLRTGQAGPAGEERARLGEEWRRAQRDRAALKNVIPLAKLLAIPARLLEAELAAAAGDFERSIERAREAVRIESALEADEPPAWHMPSRHTLGARLLEAGRAEEAERVYRDDLGVHPENGWSLAGLAASLERQGKSAAADEVRARLGRAWASADVAIAGSRL